MHLRYLTMKFITLLAISCFSVASASAAEGKSEKVMMRDGKVVICAQQSINGFASGVYDTAKDCNADKNNLSGKAVADAKDRCNSFCKDMECKPPTYPKKIPATAACKAVSKKKTYGTAKTTNPLLCRCTQ
ncbi:MAG: hypothetical protein ACRBBN_01755 [Methyloligellaceae bacterium]